MDILLSYKQKGFSSNLDENTEYYYKLCEIQKWLRDVHKIDVFIVRSNDKYYPIDNTSGLNLEVIGMIYSSFNSKWEYYNNYEGALERALEVELKTLININYEN